LEHKEYHRDINEFFNLTIRALRNIRNALFSLAFFVSQKEKSKGKEAEGKIGELQWTHDWEKDDELTKLADKYAEDVRYLVTIERKEEIGKQSLWDVLSEFSGTVEGPKDWSEEHDHYLYGTPRHGKGRRE
jgi:hypothetical protein